MFGSPTDHSWDSTGTQRVHIKGKEGWCKRYATVMLTIRAAGSQPNVGIIFRGTGKRISKYEWDAHKANGPNVQVFFQTNAWCDGVIFKEYLETIWKNHCAQTKAEFVKTDYYFRRLLTYDRLKAHNDPAAHLYLTTVLNKPGFHTETRSGPEGQTQAWQPVDQYPGFVLRSMFNTRREDEQMHNYIFAEKWENENFEASEMRICMVKWLQQAIQEYLLSGDPDKFKRAFVRTGLLMTLDASSSDDKITPQNYSSDNQPYTVPRDNSCLLLLG